MGLAQGQSASIFFINVFSEHATDGGGRVFPVDSSQKHGKISYVDAVFLLKMPFQLVDRDRSIGERRPSPMVFAIHDAQDFFLKAAIGQWSRHTGCLPDRALVTIPARRRSMKPVTVQNPEEILSLLADVALRGSGFVTECLLDYVLDEGFTEPIYLNASGEDPDAYFKGQSPAWAVYQVREWKRVLTISGGSGKQRRVQITETP